jgi:hypothetical protein
MSDELYKKLGIRPQVAGLVVAPPPDDDNPLLPLPEGFTVVPTLDQLADATGPFDFVLVFARDRTGLASAFTALAEKVAPNGTLWVSWLKQSSDRRGAALVGDINENLVRRLALTHAMVDVKVATLDRNWSALRLVRRKH